MYVPFIYTRSRRATTNWQSIRTISSTVTTTHDNFPNYIVVSPIGTTSPNRVYYYKVSIRTSVSKKAYSKYRLDYTKTVDLSTSIHVYLGTNV